MRTLGQIRTIAAGLFAAQRGNCILAVLFYTLLTGFFASASFVPFIGVLAVILFSYPLAAGLYHSFLKGVRGERMDPADLFAGFTGGRFGRVLGGSLFMELKIFLWMLPGLTLIMIGMIYLFITVGTVRGLSVEVALSCLPPVLMLILGYLLMLVIGIIKQYSYILTPYILMECPAVSPTRAVNLSKRMMSGHKWQLFILELSFLGWLLLGILTLGILNIVYTTPRMLMTRSAFYYEVKQDACANGTVRPDEFMGAIYD